MKFVLTACTRRHMITGDPDTRRKKGEGKKPVKRQPTKFQIDNVTAECGEVTNLQEDKGGESA